MKSLVRATYADDLMGELRKNVGPEIELMIDAHGNFDVSTDRLYQKLYPLIPYLIQYSMLIFRQVR